MKFVGLLNIGLAGLLHILVLHCSHAKIHSPVDSIRGIDQSKEAEGITFTRRRVKHSSSSADSSDRKRSPKNLRNRKKKTSSSQSKKKQKSADNEKRGNNVDSGDLQIRFSKINLDPVPDSMNVPSDFLPLTAADYPISGFNADVLKETTCPSVVVKGDYEIKDIDIVDLIEAVGGYPYHPSSTSSDPYWDELRQVIDVRKQRQNGESTQDVMPLPKIWEGYSLDDCAEAVHDEFPGIHHIELIQSFLKEGIELDYDVIPRRCNVEFLHKPVLLSDLNTWAINTVGPYNFAAKYHVGLARPEEICWLISQGGLTQQDGVPDDIIDDVNQMNLTSMEDFTAYPEGCPQHPSWPAMHSAASSASLWLAVVLNLTPEQWCQSKLVDFGISHARTVAGVHYPMDNYAGLKFGQEVLARKLPKFLSAKYGSSKKKIEEKVARVRFDWDTFDPWSCS